MLYIYFNHFNKVKVLDSYCTTVASNAICSERVKSTIQHTKHVKFCQVILSERAGTVDIIRYLLSYTYSSSESYSEGKELIDSAVRNIMAELVSFTGLSQSSSFAESNPKQSSLSQHERFSRPQGQNIEMKRGDWICTRYANSNILFLLYD